MVAAAVEHSVGDREGDPCSNLSADIATAMCRTTTAAASAELATASETVELSDRKSSSWLQLPDEILFHVVRFCAAPTLRAHVVCHQLALTSQAAARRLLHSNTTSSSVLWETMLHDDYGVVTTSTTTTSSRRSSKRLKRCPLDQVRDAHRLIRMHTEIAYYYLSELVACSSNTRTKNNKTLLTRARLVSILDEYGPRLRINAVVSSGGTFLVEVCRARGGVPESTILHCVQELVERRGALVNVPTSEGGNRNTTNLTALCVAAARGMPKLVRYLLEQGADASLRMSGRFRTTGARQEQQQQRRSSIIVHCRQLTALEFAQRMERAELDAGAQPAEAKLLRKCIRLLLAATPTATK